MKKGKKERLREEEMGNYQPVVIKGEDDAWCNQTNQTILLTNDNKVG